MHWWSQLHGIPPAGIPDHREDGGLADDDGAQGARTPALLVPVGPSCARGCRWPCPHLSRAGDHQPTYADSRHRFYAATARSHRARGPEPPALRLRPPARGDRRQAGPACRHAQHVGSACRPPPQCPIERLMPQAHMATRRGSRR
jgi:hypothetical protein